MLRSSRTGPTKIGSLTRASAVLVGALVALFGVIAGPLLGVFATSASAATGSGYTAITPYRALGTAAAGANVVAGTPANVQITSATAGEVPAGATAVVLNVTASNPTSAGYLTVYPEGGTAPATSNVNFTAGETVPNLVTVPLSTAGGISVANFAGTTAVDVDVEGYYSTTGAGLYNPVAPVRVAGTPAAGAAIGNNAAIPVTVTGSGIPTTATAVVVNLTAAGGSSASYLSAYAAGATPATTSSVNFTAGETVANRDVVNVGTGGQIEVYNFSGTVNVDVDVDGYYGATGSAFTPLATPVRVSDTRVPTNGAPITSGGTETFELSTAASGIPTTATAVAANFTVVPGAAPGYIQVFPTGEATPTGAAVTSDLNWPASSGPVANFTQADTAGTPTGSVQVYNLNSGSPVDLVVDAFGYFGSGTASVSVGNAPITLPGTGTSPTVVGTAIPANGTSTETITATVLSTATGHAPVANDVVSFAVSPTTGVGTLATPTATTNASGIATDVYTAPANATNLAATATIAIQDAVYGQTGTVTIAQTAPPSTIAVTGNANVPAVATATETVSALVTPFTGETAAGDVVTFAPATGAAANTTGSCGTFATTTAVPTTTPAGTPATVTSLYTPGTHSAVCTFTASDTLGGSATFIIDQTTSPTPAAGSLTLTVPTASPDNLPAGSVTPITVTVVAKDSSSQPIVGDPVTFTPVGDCGASTENVGDATIAGGIATYSYTPVVTAGTCTISAQEANTGASTSAVIVQTAPTETVVLTPANGATVPVGTATPVSVAVTHDGVAATGTDTVTYALSGTCGTLASPTEPIALTAGSGSSTADTYTASGTNGFCTITATTGTGGTATSQIAQTA
jgi:hypothetical protein